MLLSVSSLVVLFTTIIFRSILECLNAVTSYEPIGDCTRRIKDDKHQGFRLLLFMVVILFTLLREVLFISDIWCTRFSYSFSLLRLLMFLCLNYFFVWNKSCISSYHVWSKLYIFTPVVWTKFLTLEVGKTELEGCRWSGL